ncbi:MobF family relaxase [Microbacterium aurum]
MKGGVILFRGIGAAARRYLESDRSTADEYYLEGGTALAEFTVTDSAGEIIEAWTLDPVQYAAWVDWTDPISGTSMGTPRGAGEGMRGSPRFAEMVINAPKSLSIAAALHPEVSDVLDAAQQDAAAEIRRWLAQHSVTRIGPRHAREIVPVQQLQTVAVAHKTSRAGDPHRHIHFQIGTRVDAAGKWRGLDTAALFKQQGAIRALGTAIIAAHPQLAAVLDKSGLTLDPATGEVAELEPFNAALSKRGTQVERNLATFEAEWEAAHPGEEPGPVVRARLKAKAWEHERPGKKPTVLGSEAGWRVEASKTPATARMHHGRTGLYRSRSTSCGSRKSPLVHLTVRRRAHRRGRCTRCASTSPASPPSTASKPHPRSYESSCNWRCSSQHRIASPSSHPVCRSRSTSRI